MSFIMIQRSGPEPTQGGGGSEGFPDFASEFGVTWEPVLPAEPSGLASTSVNNLTELHAAMALGGREITLNPGTSYGSVQLQGTNNLILVSDNVSIASLGGAANMDTVTLRYITPRDPTSVIKFLEWNGNNYNSFGTDVLLDGIYVENDDSTSNRWATDNSAIINSHLIATFYGQYTDVGSAGRPTNVTLWNNIIQSNGQSLTRWTGIERLICCGNRLIQTSGGRLLRFYTLSDVWCSHNQIEAPNGSFGCLVGIYSSTGPPVIQTVGLNFRNNDIYNDGTGTGNGDAACTYEYVGGGSTADLRDCVLYSDTGGTGWPDPGTGLTMTNLATQAYTTPPVWGFA